MAPIACRACGPVKICGPIERHPPIGPCFNMVRKPAALLNVPLRRERIIIVAALGKVPLLPAASIDESYLVEAKSYNRVWVCKVPKHGLRVLPGVADHVRHARLLPPLVGFSVAFLATFGSN